MPGEPRSAGAPHASSRNARIIVPQGAAPPAVSAAGAGRIPPGQWTVGPGAPTDQDADMDLDEDESEHDAGAGYDARAAIALLQQQQQTLRRQQRAALAGDGSALGRTLIDAMRQAAGGRGTAGAAAFEALTANMAREGAARTAAGGAGAASPLRHKIVYQLRCAFCAARVCSRAMKAILLADTKIELYSTDIPPSTALHLLEDDRMTQGCSCRIRDSACVGCGNVLGYHVSQPCERCLDAKNNGHFWMFYSETVAACERPDPAVPGRPLYWGALVPMREVAPASDLAGAWIIGSGDNAALCAQAAARYEAYCR